MIRNFLFHRVSPHRDPLWDPIDVALFDKCISYISQNYQVMLLEDLVQRPDIVELKNVATIQFDDGYKDNIEYAAPILAKYKCKASFYVVTDCIEKDIPTWTYMLDYYFQMTNISNLNLTFDYLPSRLHISSLPTKKSRQDYVKALKPYLKTISYEQQNLVLKKVFDAYCDVDLPKIMMDWQDLLKLYNLGHYIGSHTKSHPMLGRMTDEKDIKKELLQSANMIEKNLGYFPKTISYPIGSFNKTTIRLSREAGYSIGLAVKQKMYDPSIDSIYEIPRIELYNENWLKTKMRMTNVLEKIKRTIGYKNMLK